MVKCKYCGSTDLKVKDKVLNRYTCKSCSKTFTNNDKPPLSAKNVISMTELKQRHDVDFKVMEALKGLKKDEFIEKDELIRRVGLRPGYPRMSATIDSYKEYFGRADSKMYWGHPEDIAQLKEEGTLQ